MIFELDGVRSIQNGMELVIARMEMGMEESVQNGSYDTLEGVACMPGAPPLEGVACMPGAMYHPSTLQVPTLTTMVIQLVMARLGMQEKGCLVSGPTHFSTHPPTPVDNVFNCFTFK